MGKRTVTKEELVKLGCLNPEDYKTRKTRNLKFWCKNCSNNIVVTSLGVIRNNGKVLCRECKTLRQRDIAYNKLQEKLKEAGCINPKDYVNNTTWNLNFSCTKCGEVYTCSWNGLRQHSRLCKVCSLEASKNKQKLSLKVVKEEGCLNSEDYINAGTSNLHFTCEECGRIYTTSLSSFREQPVKLCKNCSRHRVDALRKIPVDKLKAIGCLNIEDYITADTHNLLFPCTNCDSTYTTRFLDYKNHSHLCSSCIKEKNKKEHIAKAKKRLEATGCKNIEDYTGATDHNLLFPCTNCGSTYTTSFSIYLNHSKLCSKCNATFSKPEEELAEYVKSIYSGKIERNYRDKDNGISELDIYLPELNYAIEFNGIIWHSEKYQKNINYHKNKTDACSKLGITLWHIWEDDWVYKKDLIKAMLRSIIVKDNKRIFARKCEVREVTDNKLIKKFMNTNHLQGFVGSTIKYGLYFNDELYSLMTFAVSKGTWTLNRFCTKVGYTIVGGASKLIKHFQKEHKGVDVYSFSDNTYSGGGLYETLGFKNIGTIRVDYKYLYKGKLEHKFSFRHKYLGSKLKTYDSTLSEHENCLRNGVYRVYDSGKIKWVLQNEN